MLVLALIGVVLLQKSEGGGLVSSSSGFLTGRGTANVLTRTTALLAAGFFLTSLALSWFAGFERKPTSIITTGAPAGQEAPAVVRRPRRSIKAVAVFSASWAAASRVRLRRRSAPANRAGRKCRNRTSGVRPAAVRHGCNPQIITGAGVSARGESVHISAWQA